MPHFDRIFDPANKQHVTFSQSPPPQLVRMPRSLSAKSTLRFAEGGGPYEESTCMTPFDNTGLQILTRRKPTLRLCHRVWRLA